MKRLSRRALAAIVFVLLILSAPLWLSSLQVFAAPNADVSSNPFEDASTFYILDAGWTTGNLAQRVLAVPQVLAWTPGQKDATWAAETGFIYGGFRDPETGHIYITEQRNTNHESLMNVTFAGDVLYANSSDWFMHLTVLDAANGEVVSRTVLDLPARNTSGAVLHPIGISGDTLYLMNYAYRNHLLAYDLRAGELTGDAWSLCEGGYITEAVFLAAEQDMKSADNQTASRVAALCVGRTSDTESTVTLTNLESKEQSSLDIPVLGKEEYQTGNGMFLANESLYVIESEAGVLVEINMDTLQIVQSSHYRDDLVDQQTSWVDDLIGWLGEQIVEPAAAKRWMAIIAVSPDGQWVAVDGGYANSEGKELFLIDLQTLKATESFELPRLPAQMIFGNDGNLLVLFDKRNAASPTPGVLLNVVTGEEQTVAAPTHGWVRGILPAN